MDGQYSTRSGGPAHAHAPSDAIVLIFLPVWVRGGMASNPTKGFMPGDAADRELRCPVA